MSISPLAKQTKKGTDAAQTAVIPVWAQQFGQNYAAIPDWLDAMVRQGVGTDESWHHDVCPKFHFKTAANRIICMAVHPLDASKREFQSIKRFEFFWDDDESDGLIETDADERDISELSTDDETRAREVLAEFGFRLFSPEEIREFNAGIILQMDDYTRKFCKLTLEYFIERWELNTDTDQTAFNNHLADYLTDEIAVFFKFFGFKPQSADELLHEFQKI